MSLTTIMNAGVSGLMTAQNQLRVISSNVSNANTPGYIRKEVQQTNINNSGVGAGVELGRVRIAADRYLQHVSRTSAADAGKAEVGNTLYGQLQGLFGDPSGKTGFFSRASAMSSAFAVASEDPQSAPRRMDAMNRLSELFNEGTRIGTGIQELREDADKQIAANVRTVNSLLTTIDELNTQISRGNVTMEDTTDAEIAQSRAIDELSRFMDVKVTSRPTGGIVVRTGTGTILAGEGLSQLSYSPTSGVKSGTAFDEIWIDQSDGNRRALADQLKSGELKGLLDLRDKDSVAAAEQLGELMSVMADELNRAHNAASSVPAPNRLSGRNTNLTLSEAITGFSGTSTVAILNANGTLNRRVDINFSTGQMTNDGGVTNSAFTPANFDTVLNGLLGASGSVSFSNGALSIQAGAGLGVALQDQNTPVQGRNGQGFSHFFGLNDLVQNTVPTNYKTGLSGTSNHGFTAGQTLTLRVGPQDGARIRDITIAIPAGGTINDLLTSLNDPVNGVGGFGTFSLSAQGELKFTGAGSPPMKMQVVKDNTTRLNAGGPSVSAFFGLGGIPGQRLETFAVRGEIQRNTATMALSKLDLTVPSGRPVLVSGDGRGARGLADIGDLQTGFAAAGDNPGGTMSLNRYVSDLAGQIGNKAATYDTRLTSAEAVAREADSRRRSTEGVNLDEELVKMTTYQQAYNASSRMIQAAKDMYDILLSMVR
ncbi:MAG: flagellar hook-associated protein FlgK [Asticcacaulis sp.]